MHRTSVWALPTGGPNYNIRTVMCLALKWHRFLSVENVNWKIAWHFVPRLVV
ncbi:hypothetical protein [Wolbachia endosymbiont (group A) of Anomoia purmunda]|uniref:hypothetical protein n=1 Tax=Wolbachia endosymbiont (group A) of Anomoia purmunda TaxID=2953978 RepID=UPI0022301E99|nr:hypothetical protein [Wolbachia endosymbiont (group A) of Anomoia purmunda]